MLDVIIRDASASDIDALIDVNIRVWRSTYRGIIHDEMLDAMTPDSLRDKWLRVLARSNSTDSFCYVACLNDKPVGYVMCGTSRDASQTFDWELYAIYILQEHQGKGIGKQLFDRSVQEMKRRHARSFILYVLEENRPTRLFYESFKPDQQIEKTVELGGRKYQEVGYRWHLHPE